MNSPKVGDKFVNMDDGIGEVVKVSFREDCGYIARIKYTFCGLEGDMELVDVLTKEELESGDIWQPV